MNHSHRGISLLSEYIREIIYGGTDGIITTFAVVSGFTGAASNDEGIAALGFGTVLLFGFANLFADGVSMGLGNFLSQRASADMFYRERKNELRRIHLKSEHEKREADQILKEKGFSLEDTRSFISILERNREYYADWMMEQELQQETPSSRNTLLTTLATTFSFMTFGTIPLLPFFFESFSNNQSFIVSALSTLMALVLLGVLRWRVTKSHFVRSIGEIVLIGSTAASVAFLVGTFFK